MDFSNLQGRQLHEAVDQYIHGGHRKAIQTASKVARNNNPELIPPTVIKQREAKYPGKYVMPKFDNSMEDLLKQKGPKTKYGHDVFQAGYVDYDSNGTYEVHPHVARFIGDPGVQQTFVGIFGTDPIVIKKKPDEKKAVAAAQNASAVSRKMVGLRKPKQIAIKEWLVQNRSVLDPEVALLTLQNLKVVDLSESVANPKQQTCSNHNFNAGTVTNPFSHNLSLLH